ncbi:MAG: hypothetical protein Q8Q92_03655 [bacterium]|nr:hypothetical protein [bacterium]
MKELRRKQKIRRIIYSIPLLVALLILAFFLARGALRVLNKEWESSTRLKNLAEKAAVITLREQELKENIARLQTEEGVKDEIKERFNVTQEGEHVAVIVDDRGLSSSTDTSTLPWYKKFWIAMTRILANIIE